VLFSGPQVISGLLAAGADPNASVPAQDPRTGELGRATPLAAAAAAGCVGAVRLLLSAGANLELAAGDDGDTPLMHAARYGRPEVLRLLLDAGADPGSV
jgi:ankyrin repeat protein